MLPDVFETRRKMVELQPSNEQPRALYELNSEKLAADMSDFQWEQWYDHYHTIVLRPDDRDSFFHFGYNLRINLESAAVYVLVSCLFVPRLRHWWVILLAAMWVLMLVAEEYSAVQKLNNKWATLPAQIKYLSETKSAE